MEAYFFLFAGLALLIISGEALVRGAVAISTRYKISKLVVGMTVVSFGTSAPELLVSLEAALGGHPDIAIGNVVGSNVANIALVLGLTAIIIPLPIDNNTIKYDWPIMMIATSLFYLFISVIDAGLLDRIESFMLVILLVAYTIWILKKSRNKTQKEAAESKMKELDPPPFLKNLSLILAGCGGLVLGADWLVDGAVKIASSFGVSERIIGITVIAFGTSAPELFTSCVAAFRKQTDISIGNLIGSNLFNICAVLGITGVVAPDGIPVDSNVLQFDIYWVLAITAVLLPMMLIRKKIMRVEGFILFSAYLTYIYLLF